MLVRHNSECSDAYSKMGQKWGRARGHWQFGMTDLSKLSNEVTTWGCNHTPSCAFTVWPQHFLMEKLAGPAWQLAGFPLLMNIEISSYQLLLILKTGLMRRVIIQSDFAGLGKRKHFAELEPEHVPETLSRNSQKYVGRTQDSSVNDSTCFPLRWKPLENNMHMGKRMRVTCGWSKCFQHKKIAKKEKTLNWLLPLYQVLHQMWETSWPSVAFKSNLFKLCYSNICLQWNQTCVFRFSWWACGVHRWCVFCTWEFIHLLSTVTDTDLFCVAFPIQM